MNWTVEIIVDVESDTEDAAVDLGNRIVRAILRDYPNLERRGERIIGAVLAEVRE